MTEIMALLHCLDQSLPNKTTLRRLSLIIFALLAMTGRVTMLGISPWTGEGGSYRTIQRFFNTEIVWHQVLSAFIKHWLADETDVFLLAADETVVSKAGKATFGLDRFFSSLLGKPIHGLAFLAFSVISSQRRQSFVVRLEQLQKKGFTKQPANHQEEAKPKEKRGRPKGSQNKNRRDMTLSFHLQVMQKWLKEVLLLLKTAGIQVTYFVFDGVFGNNNALQMVNHCGLHLISKLRHDALLFFPYEAEQKKRGAPRKYGARLHYRHIPHSYLKSRQVEGEICTDVSASFSN